MYFARAGFAATLFFLAALAVSPGAAAAGGAAYIKGGAMRLLDNGQAFDTPTHIPVSVNLDDISYRTIGFGWEKRLRHGWAVGTEYLNFRNRFTPSASPITGIAETHAFQVVAKKYFFDSGIFHPYVGGGFGTGYTDIDNTDGGGVILDQYLSVLLHVALGMELRIDHLSFMLEVKHMYFGVSDNDVEYDPSATGVLLGMGFNW
jgi:hypothetical protein